MSAIGICSKTGVFKTTYNYMSGCPTYKGTTCLQSILASHIITLVAAQSTKVLLVCLLLDNSLFFSENGVMMVILRVALP